MSGFNLFRKKGTPIPDFSKAEEVPTQNIDNTTWNTTKEVPFAGVPTPQPEASVDQLDEKGPAEEYGIAPIEDAPIPDDISFEQRQAIEAERAKQEPERRTNRLIGALMTGDASLLQAPNVSISEDCLLAYYGKVQSGEITLEQQQELIKDYIHPRWFNATTKLFSAQLKNSSLAPCNLSILGFMTSGIDKLNNPSQVNENTYFDFTQKYPNAVAFDKPSEDFVTMLKAVQSPMTEDYERSMALVKRAIYGEQQDYLDTVKALNAQAMNMTDTVH